MNIFVCQNVFPVCISRIYVQKYFPEVPHINTYDHTCVSEVISYNNMYMPVEPLCVRRHFSDGATTPVVKDRLVPQDPFEVACHPRIRYTHI